MNRGFTLVELSIVLVIIGLLIGGILVGQSLIESSKINSFIKQIQQYDIATRNFKMKYKYLPGDSPVHHSIANGDGVILDTLNTLNNYNGEIDFFWPDLSKEMGGKQYISATSTLKAGVNFPATSIGDNSGIFASAVFAGVFPTTPKINGWAVAAWNASTRNYAANTDVHESLPVTVAMAIDNKIDDAVANTGSLRAIGNNAVPTGMYQQEPPRTACATAGAYNIATTEATPCGIVIEMFAQIGQSVYK